MKSTKKWIFINALVTVALLVTVTGAIANTLTEGGGDMPFYARIERGEIINDGKWAAIIFYRPTDCIDRNFNLLDFFSFDAFACIPPTTDGFVIWSGEPWVSDPVMFELKGLGNVPVWFVKWGEMQAAIGDDILTLEELEGLPSLERGTAGFYTETLHPAGAVAVPMINYVAEGKLENGKTFKVHALVVSDTVWNVQINFK